MIDFSPILAQSTAPAAAHSVADARWFFINLAYLAASICFIFGLKMLAAPRTARRGNALASAGMVLAVLATLVDRQIMGYWTILVGLLVGGGIGVTLALRVHMKGMPQMVSLFNGFGGLAAAMVGMGKYVLKVHEHARDPVAHGLPAIDLRISAGLSIVIGMITFTGSLIAWAKLEELKYKVLGQAISGPVMLPYGRIVSLGIAAALLVLMVVLAAAGQAVWAAVLLLVLAAGYGKVFVLPIGGADMPVVIALLNSFSGLGAAATGMVLHNNALVIGGSLVGAAGFILTMIMCRAMNRSLVHVLAGGFGTAASAEPGATTAAAAAGTIRRMDPEEAAMVLDAAQHVIIIPGYGMAVAQAQHAVAELASVLQKKGVNVRFAVHPVAGRMPGHMNVLLAEANVPYDLLADLEINPEFAHCDVALVIGANDVVNPAARHDTTSPIYGMPIFDADKARTVMVCKRSLNPGFAGIENELFYLPNNVMLFGDAKATVAAITKAIKEM